MRALVAALIVLASLLGPLRTAETCKCQRLPLRRAFANADFVFFGRIVKVERVRHDGKSIDEIAVKVESVWKGRVGATTVVTSPASSCGLFGLRAPEPGQRFLFFAKRDGDGLTMRKCDAPNPTGPVVTAPE